MARMSKEQLETEALSKASPAQKAEFLECKEYGWELHTIHYRPNGNIVLIIWLRQNGKAIYASGKTECDPRKGKISWSYTKADEVAK